MVKFWTRSLIWHSEENSDDLSDELDLFWVVDGGGLVSVFVLDTIFDGMMILSSLCFAHSEASEGILDVV